MTVKVLLWSQPLSMPFVSERLRRLDGITLTAAGSEREAAHAVRDAEVLVIPHIMYAPQIEEAVRSSRTMRWIQLLTAGYENLKPGMVPSRIRITSAGEGLAPIVAEHAIALLLAVGHKLAVTLANQRQSKWDRSVKDGMFSLYGKSLAVVGFGPIGQAVARNARALGMRILAVSLRGRPSDAADETFAFDRLGDVLARSDAVVIALPRTGLTEGMFDHAMLQASRDGILFVNVGRGSVVDQSALADALKSGKLGGAGLDVTDPEPLPSDSPLWQSPNVIITPHCASGGGYDQLGAFVADNIGRYLAGEEPHCRIIIE